MNKYSSTSFFAFTSKSDIIKIITITSLVFVILQFIRITLLIGGEDETYYIQSIWNKLTLPSTFQEVLYQPWCLLTYIFCDMSFMQIIGNMIWLWVFGSVIEDLLGSLRIFPIYIFSGILGALLLLGFNTLTHTSNTFHFGGSMAALTGVVVATSLYKPKYTFWILFNTRIELWVFTIVYFILLAIPKPWNHFNILCLIVGGVLIGIVYNYGLNSLFESSTNSLKRMSAYMSNNNNFVVKSKRKKTTFTNTELPFNSININEKKLDALLDKINKFGMQSLSESELRSLNEYSKK